MVMPRKSKSRMGSWLSKANNGIFADILVAGEAEELTFSDVKKEDWYYNYVAIAKKAGYITGHADGTFKGNDYLTREQTCTIVSRVAGFTSRVSSFSIVAEVPVSSPEAEPITFTFICVQQVRHSLTYCKLKTALRQTV